MIEGFCIVRSHPDLILYVDHLQKKNVTALSFYPRCVFERESKEERIFLGLLNGQPCGYLYAGATNPDLKVHQVCIEYDIRRNLYGTALVSTMEQYAEQGGCYTITLRCGFDLDANNFWAGMGYRCVAIVDGGIRRNRKINIWRKVIRSELFVDNAVVPAVGKIDDSIWRKGKQKGIVNAFARGRRLKDYRKVVSEP